MAEITITAENFETEVLDSELPVLVDFWASWCGPCKMIGPVISEIAEEYAGKIKVGKINVDEQMDLAIRHQVASIPTLMLFKDGEVVKRTVGAQPKENIVRMFE
jgi:thioredoxin 1